LVLYLVRLVHDRTGWFATMDDAPPRFPAIVHWSWEFTDSAHAASVLGVADSIARCFNSGLYRWRGQKPPKGGCTRLPPRDLSSSAG
jgi:hypothetical protein